MEEPEYIEQLASLPDRPGCYQFKDAAGAVLYVGKAENLRSRVRSYFQPGAAHTPRTAALVRQVASLQFTVTENPVEALLLESNLIKRHRPRYNVRLRDDKHYPYLCLTTAEAFARPIIVRRARRDRNRYFGPYTSSASLRQTIKAIHSIFRLRSCSREIVPGDRQKPCLDYHLGLCSAPCASLISPEEYRRDLEGVIDFLEGRPSTALRVLNDRMTGAAEQMRYEAAARYRDQMRAIEKLMARQEVLTTRFEDQDVFAIAADPVQAVASVLRLREGRLVATETLPLEGAHPDELPEALRQVVEQFYGARTENLPRSILVEHPLEDPALQQWLSELRGHRVEIRHARRGSGRRLVELAAENAAEQLKALRARQDADEERMSAALAALQQALNLDRLPRRIECYDISNLQGNQSVGAMTVIQDGMPAKGEYRRFQIRTVQGADDYASLQEVVRRRLSRLLLGDARWGQAPDLLVIDGGKGQLNAVLEVLLEFDVSIPAVGLAKRLEEVYLPTRPEPVMLDRRSQALYLLQRVRDEAHRFGLAYHRGLRGRASVRSRLDEIPGIGERRRKALLKQFGSLDKMKMASIDELAAVPGMNRSAAAQVSRALAGEQSTR